MYTFRSHRNEKGLFRWHLRAGKFGVEGEFSRRWRGGIAAHAGYGGQEHFVQGVWALHRLFFLAVSINTPPKWKRLRPRDGKYGESKAQWGLWSFGHTLVFQFGRDPWGTYYGGGSKRFRGIRNSWRNRQVPLFKPEWITGREQFSREVIDERPVEIVVGRWASDRYMAVQTIERVAWKNRFRTKRRVDYQWSIENGDGIPTDTKGKWGDLYGETMGFGATADKELPLEELIARAPAAMAERLPSLLREWPAGYIPAEFVA